MLHLEHSAIRLTFIIAIIGLETIFGLLVEWPFNTFVFNLIWEEKRC